jgi:tight adherence protein C
LKWILFVTLTTVFYLVISIITQKRRSIQQRIGIVVPDRKKELQNTQTMSQPVTKRFRVWFASFANKWLRGQRSQKWGKTQMKLAYAGNPFGLTIGEWIGFRVLIVCLCTVVGFVLFGVMGDIKGILLFISTVLLGWIGPDFFLSKKATQRQQEIEKVLPSALDLLTVSVEAGLGFDQALARIAQKLKGPLAEEFGRTMREMQLGSSRLDALQHLGLRTGVDGIKSFVSAIIQADKLGIGLAQVLRVQSASFRERRRLEAQERAMKAPVKILFPLVLFVFPSVFIVILGPAVIHVIQLFSHGGI